MINVVNLHKRFGDLSVLSGITMEIRPGEVSVLLGPSGGGKSTLLRTINGLETFDEGAIRLGDLELSPRGTTPDTLLRVRRRVGMVFQQFNLFPHLTALGNVIEAPMRVLRRSRDEAEAEGRELLRRVGLEQKLNARPSQLSGGQQQRVAIARALAMHPEAILFDEPTSALDPKMTAEVTAVMTDLARSGQTMIVVTHGLHFARSVANTVHILHEGRIAESGAPDRVFDDPQLPVTRAFLMQAKG